MRGGLFNERTEKGIEFPHVYLVSLVGLLFAIIINNIIGGALVAFHGFLSGAVLVWWIYCLVTRNDRSEIDPD